MNEKHSFLRDTCMLPGGAGKRVRLTVKEYQTLPNRHRAGCSYVTYMVILKKISLKNIIFMKI